MGEWEPMSRSNDAVLAGRWVRDPRVHSVELDGEALLYDGRSGRVHHLNTSACLIWSSLGQDVTGAELATEFAAAFGVPFDIMAGQVADALGMMAAEDLVVEYPREE